MNIKVEEILMVIVAFIIGYFLNGIINQNLVEGASTTNCSGITNKDKCVDNNCEWQDLFGTTNCVPARAPMPQQQMPDSDQVGGSVSKKGLLDMITDGESLIEKYCKSNKIAYDSNILNYYNALHELLKDTINERIGTVYNDCQS